LAAFTGALFFFVVLAVAALFFLFALAAGALFFFPALATGAAARAFLAGTFALIYFFTAFFEPGEAVIVL
jgi:hypothetical protein